MYHQASHFDKDNPVLNSNNEIWIDIENFEGRYQISNHGNCRSIQNNHGTYRIKEKRAYTRSSTCKYLYVNLSKKDVSHTDAVHRLVAKAFIPNPDNKPMVNHLDGDKLNNNAWNLEWVTCSENHKHAFATGLRNAQHCIDRFLGKKYGNDSKYHNVSWDTTRGKWKASLKHNRKTVCQKRFDSEIDAALYVNFALDSIGDTERPRNIIP